jgi:hypothetical protein
MIIPEGIKTRDQNKIEVSFGTGVNGYVFAALAEDTYKIPTPDELAS